MRARTGLSMFEKRERKHSGDRKREWTHLSRWGDGDDLISPFSLFMLFCAPSLRPSIPLSTIKWKSLSAKRSQALFSFSLSNSHLSLLSFSLLIPPLCSVSLSSLSLSFPISSLLLPVSHLFYVLSLSAYKWKIMTVEGGGIKRILKKDMREERRRGKKIKKSQPVRCAEREVECIYVCMLSV